MAWEKIKKIMGVPEEEFLEEEEYRSDYNREAPRSYSAPSMREPARKKDDQFLNINATAQLQVVLVKPEGFNEASEIADHLINKHTVLLNLEGANRETIRRLIDFLSGVAYAQGGNLKRVANGTFIITPYDVDIMGEVLDELKTDGMVF